MRQMGDAILSTSLLNTLRRNFPDACIDFVLQERIAPLFEGHKSIDHIITFTDEERHRPLAYMRKVHRIVSSTHYDIIIDMRSTVNTMLFALLSPGSRYRIGLSKPYTWLAFSHRVVTSSDNRSIIDHDISFALPLEGLRKIEPVRDFTLDITDAEVADFGQYLRSGGIDLSRPIMLANVTAKLASKVWAEDRMTEVIQRFITHHPDWQVVFNYAPGAEEANARRIYSRLGAPRQVFIDIMARSPRQLAAMGHYLTLFFGNEGGARHIMQASGCPSLVVCAPENLKEVWIPQTGVLAEGISPMDFASPQQLSQMDREEQYGLVTADAVWEKLEEMVISLQALPSPGL